MISNKKIFLLITILILTMSSIYFVLKLEPKKATTIINETESQEQNSEIETKIPISRARFDEIKTFILTQNDISLPKKMTKNEKTKIEEFKISFQKQLQDKKDFINKNQIRIDNYNNTLNEIDTKIIELERQKETKPNEINEIQNEISKLKTDKDTIIEEIDYIQEIEKILERDFKIELNKRLKQIYEITN